MEEGDGLPQLGGLLLDPLGVEVAAFICVLPELLLFDPDQVTEFLYGEVVVHFGAPGPHRSPVVVEVVVAVELAPLPFPRVFPPP